MTQNNPVRHEQSTEELSGSINRRVLFVDDEKQVLEGIKLHLRREFEVATAIGAEEGMRVISTQPAFAVVVSDMRMPKINGADFLANVRRVAPDTVRMLLTGQPDIAAAAAAINRGQIYRFLAKPCPPKTLVEALDAGVNHYQIQKQRTEILEKTLGSSVKLLTDLLGIASPSGFGRANRIKQLANKMADLIGFKAEWYMDVAAMFSQVGLMIAPDLAEKLEKGKGLSTDDMVNLQQLPTTAAILLSGIIHMQPVRTVLNLMPLEYSKVLKAENDSEYAIVAQILAVAADYDSLELQGFSSSDSLGVLRDRGNRYDPGMLEMLGAILSSNGLTGERKPVTPHDLVPGQVFAEDVQLKNGTLLAVCGSEVTPSVISFLQNRQNKNVPDRLVVYTESLQGDLQSH